MSEPSADAGDAEAVPAQEKDLDQQLQRQGQAVGSGGSPPEGAAEEVEVTTQEAEWGEVPTEQTEEAADVPAPSGDAVPGTSGTGTDGGSTGSGVADDGSINEELARLESDAATARAEKVQADAALADLENRLATLRSVQQDADAATTAYAAGYERLSREDEAYEEYLEFQDESLRERLGEDGVAEVEALVTAWSDRADDLDTAVTTAARTLADAESERDRLKGEVKECSDDLAGWKKLTATVTAQHTDLKTRREEITKARQAGEYALAFWLLGQARTRRESFDDGPRLIDPDDLEEELLDAVDELAKAQKELAAAELAATLAKADLAAATKARDKHRAESEAQLRESLRTAGTHATTGEPNA